VRDASTFRLLLEPTPSAFEEHPAWAPYEDPEDHEALLSWGVDPVRLDQALNSFDGFAEGYTHPLYPVLDIDSFKKLGHLFLATMFTLANGRTVRGFMIDDYAFGMFIGDDYAMFNVRLPDICRDAGAKIRAAYCSDNTPAFPAQFTRAIAIQGLPQRGTIRVSW